MIGVLEVKLKRLLAPYETKGERATEAQRLFRQRVKGILIFGVCTQIALAIWLASTFNKTTLSKLGVIMDNIERLKGGDKLRPQITGQDELASMDATFHMMADSITSSTEKLKASELSIRAIIEGLPIGVIVLDDKRSIKSLNPSAEELFGFKTDEIQSSSISRLLCSFKRVDIRDVESYVFDGEDKSANLIGLDKPGKRPLLEVTSRKFSSPYGDGYLVCLMDITERERIEQLKRDFTAMITHDLRSPLSAIKMSIQFTKGKLDTISRDDLQKKLTQQELNCNRLLSLINNLLDLDKLESGSMELNLEIMNVGILFKNAVIAIETLAESKSIKIIEERVCDSEVIADPDRIVQVLVNLLSNALKFSEDGQNIELSFPLINGQ